MTWRDLVYHRTIAYCNEIESRTFSLSDFFAANEDVFRSAYPNNRFPRQKVCEMLQKLRDAELITFLKNTGNYTLRGVELLDVEREETTTIELSKETPDKREYLVETYVRKAKWAQRAREAFGDYCLYDKCKNTFLRNDGTPYIEVHHIIFLCRNGEDSLPNLSVLCAHHHRMAHFAHYRTKKHLQCMLLSISKDMLRNFHA